MESRERMTGMMEGKDGNIGKGRIGRYEREGWECRRGTNSQVLEEGWKCRRGTNRQVEEGRIGM
jgi:hypothetical protein